jgi:hypothetical protein
MGRILAKLACYVSEHWWGNGEYLAENDCRQRHVCQRCQASEERTNHDWDLEEYIDDCQSRRVCTRCKTIETFADHDWIEYEYNDPEAYNDGLNNYIVGAMCTRCHIVK